MFKSGGGGAELLTSANKSSIISSKNFFMCIFSKLLLSCLRLFTKPQYFRISDIRKCDQVNGFEIFLVNKYLDLAFKGPENL